MLSQHHTSIGLGIQERGLGLGESPGGSRRDWLSRTIGFPAKLGRTHQVGGEEKSFGVMANLKLQFSST